MIFMILAIGIAAAFVVSSFIALRYGQYLGHRYRKLRAVDGTGGLGIIEGAIFSLMGLLLAFTISGGMQRFDDRRQLVIQETTAAITAYDRLGLFEGELGRKLQSKLKNYIRGRIDLYRMPHDLIAWQTSEDFSHQQKDELVELKKELWDAALPACYQETYRTACMLSLPALNTLFDAAQQRAGASEKHPPRIIHIMLFGLGLGCSLLAGFGMAAAGGQSWIHMALFVGTLTIALYIITDMEYPRLGLIRIESFDHFLADAYEQMR
jgi:hypothetical protein